MAKPLFLANIIHLSIALAVLSLFLLSLHLQERTTSRFVSHRLGWNAVLVTGWIGVPIHEFSHLLFAWLFRHRIIAWRLFDPDPVSGTLGYVRHAYQRRKPWQLIGTFFIGIGPVLIGTPLLIVLLWWMIPKTVDLHLFLDDFLAADKVTARVMLASIYRGTKEILLSIWLHKDLWLILKIYFGICVANHLAPSASDLKGALPGGLSLAFVLVLVVGVVSWVGIHLVGVYPLIASLVFLYIAVTFFQLVYIGIVFLLAKLF